MGRQVDWTSERELAKAIILEIVRASGGIFHGATRLYKAFLFAHLYHFRDMGKMLSSWRIVHMPNGHGIDKGQDLIGELVGAKKLEVCHEEVGPYTETIYKLIDGEGKNELPLEDRKSVEKAARFVQGKTGKQLSRIVHEHTSYKSGRSGEALHIYIDAIPEELVIEEEERISTIMKSLGEVFEN